MSKTTKKYREPLFSDRAARKDIVNSLSANFFASMDRAEALVSYSKKLLENEGRSNEIEDVASDILRSAVVFVHATLEDLLRSLAEVLLPYCDEDALNKIPLVGMERPEKFSLGKLAAHREKKVLEVIQESVAKYLLKTTYNNRKDICDLMKSLKVDIDRVKSLLPEINALMERRHQIVHRTDKAQKELEPITSEQVAKWIDSVKDFFIYTMEDMYEPL